MASNVKRQLVQELHRQARVTFKRRPVHVRALDETFQADLVEMVPYASENNNFRYVLIVIDIMSKFAWGERVKHKTGLEVSRAMQKIFKKDNRIPKNMHTDSGKEFYNKHFKDLMKKYNINHYSTFSSKKASIVERVNRTLKSLMWKRFSLQGSYRWINILQDILQTYNAKKHRTIKMKPMDVTKKDEKRLLNEIYNRIKTVDKRGIKFHVGQHVRISKHRTVFHKSYTGNWSNEIFIIDAVQLGDPVTYLLRDYSNHPILGSFYNEELQKVKYPDIFLVEKVLRRKGDMVYVKWLGFDASHNSWIHKSNAY